VSFSAPSEFVALCHLLQLRKAVDASFGVAFFFATSTTEIHYSKFPIACLPVRPQRFSRSRRVHPSVAFWTYFIPKPRTRFLFRVFPRLPALTARRSDLPSRRLTTDACKSELPRLTPASLAPPSRLCSDNRSVNTDKAVKPCPSLDSLLSFHSLRLSPKHLGTTFAAPPLLALVANSSCDFSNRPSAYQSVFGPFGLSPAF
jgi:hypothetical protein